MKDVQATGEASSPQRRTSSISKQYISSLLSFLSQSGSGTSKVNADSDPDPVPQYCPKHFGSEFFIQAFHLFSTMFKHTYFISYVFKKKFVKMTRLFCCCWYGLHSHPLSPRHQTARYWPPQFPFASLYCM
jgi:hypothetical protein